MGYSQGSNWDLADGGTGSLGVAVQRGGKNYFEISQIIICLASSVVFSLHVDCDQLTCAASPIFTALAKRIQQDLR